MRPTERLQRQVDRGFTTRALVQHRAFEQTVVESRALRQVISAPTECGARTQNMTKVRKVRRSPPLAIQGSQCLETALRMGDQRAFCLEALCSRVGSAVIQDS